jgi:CBS-domain-containing membrane protein
MRARELMSSPVVTVAPDTPLKEVAELMLSRGVSGVPVIDGDGHLVSILSESDFLPKLEQTQQAMDYIVPLFQNPAQVDLRKMKSAGGASGK